MDARAGLRLEERGEEWVLVGEGAARFGLVNEYLSHLLDRNYSPAAAGSTVLSDRHGTDRLHSTP